MEGKKSFFHLGDLHIGKKVNGFSMIEDQRYVLNQIIEKAKEKNIDFILISGDIYDRSVPNVDAVNLADEFLTNLINLGIKTYVISGNHDSSDRLEFASKIVENSGLYIYSKFDGTIHTYDFDENIKLHLFPFVRPVDVKVAYPDEKIDSYDDACETVISKLDIDKSKFNIILAHQFILDSKVCDSEEVFVGSLYGVNAKVFKDYDYIALGHLHGPQKVGGREECRYSGSILKYSFSEVNQKKSIPYCEITIDENGEKKLSIEKLPIVPIRDLVEIKGNLEDIENKYKSSKTNENYVRVILNEDDNVAALSKLREIFPNLMKLEYNNSRTRSIENFEISADEVKKDPFDMFSELFKTQLGKELTEEQLKYIRSITENLWGE